jgi:DNA-binding NtrC family response regulator
MKLSLTPMREEIEGANAFPAESSCEGVQLLTVVVVSADPAIRSSMVEVLQECYLKTIVVDGIAELKAIAPEELVVACLCGFWLADGTVQEIATYLKRQPTEIPLIMVSEPAPTREYEDFLDSLSFGAFDFVCHPYSVTKIELIAWAAIQSYCESAQFRAKRMNQSNDFARELDFRGALLRQSA